jgi:hypothetical protein
VNVNKRSPGAYLAVFLLLALALRLWGIGFGLPPTSCRPDEGKIVGPSLVFFSGSLRPVSFLYPSLHLYVVHFFARLYYLVGGFLGEYSSVTDFYSAMMLDATSLYLLSRCLSVLLGTATVVVVYSMGKSIGGSSMGLIAAFLLSLAYLHVRESHFATTDIPLTFFLACSVYFIMCCTTQPSWKNYALAGLFAGLAASTKYMGILLIAPMGIVHFFARSRRVSSPPSSYRDIGKLSLFIMVLMCVFLVGTPYSLLDFHRFLGTAYFQLRHASEGHAGIRQIGWWHHLRFSLLGGVGPTMCVAAALGIAIAIRVGLRRNLSWLAFCFVYYVSIGFATNTFVRYALPLVPFVCVAAALFTVRASERLVTLTSWRSSAVTSALVLVIAAPSIVRTIQFDVLLSRRDTRLLARDWLRDHAPDGSTVCQSSNAFGTIALPWPTARLSKDSEEAGGVAIAVERVRARMARRKHMHFPDLEEWSFDATTGGFTGESTSTGLPTYIVTIDSPLRVFTPLAPALVDITRTSYAARAEFRGCGDDVREDEYDRQDAFFLPFASFAGIERPGPNLVIYERR